MLLVGDIGGTNTRLSLFENSLPLKEVKEKRFLSNNYPSLLAAIKNFLENDKVKIDAASFGVAGPVKKGICKATNIPWIVDVNEIAKKLNISQVYLLNDLQANAYGVFCLKPEDVYVLNEGEINAKGNACILAAGTGLGEAGMFFDGEKLIPFACEGGHTDFAPRNELEITLLRFLQKKYVHVSYERILSGSGIHNLYDFLIHNKIEATNEQLQQELEKHPEPQLIITKKGVNKEHRACERAIDWFVSIYGAEAGNAALKFLAVGGVYIGGGIAPRILEKIKEGEFMKSFADKGRFARMMMSMPVKVILNDRASLYGAGYYALTRKRKEEIKI